MGNQQGIGTWLTSRVRLSPDHEAVVDGEKRVTYRQFDSDVNRMANALSHLKIRSGERIGILAYNRLEYIEVLMAAAKLGIMVVPLNWRLAADELIFNLTDSGTETLIFDPDLSNLAGEVLDRNPMKHRLVLGSEPLFGGRPLPALMDEMGADEPEPDEEVGLDTPHIIMYTAGTTGRPKGAVLSQGASFYNALNLMVDMNFNAADRNLSVLPMFHIGGIGLFTLPILYAGGTVVVQRTFDPAETLRLLSEEKITLFFGVAAIFLFLIQHENFDADRFRTVRVAMSGGAPLPVSLVRQYHEAGIILQQGFGMSEAAPSIATLGRNLALAKAGSIGRALFHVDARVVDDEMNELPTESTGELVIRGPNLMQEYWNRPEATREVFAGGWFHTGDLARMDAEGDLYIVDRKKDMFISGGENVYPAEVENALYEMQQIAEAAVIGVSDERWGEVGCAAVVLKPGQPLSEEAVIRFLAGCLAKYKVPKSVVFMNQLPRNAAGKVLKKELRNTFA
jgi:fatty-acyl-CoA synthase